MCANYLYLIGIFDIILSSWSSCHTASMDLPDPLSLPISIVYHSPEVFQAISGIDRELLFIRSRWSSWLCSSMWRGPQEHIAYELVLNSPTVSHLSGLSNINGFVMGSRWWDICCFVGCYFQDLFTIVRSTFV